MGVIDDTLGTNIFGPNSTDRAIGAQMAAANAANQLQYQMFQQQRADYEPWRQTGMRALAGLESGGFAKDLATDPGYQFRLSEGMRAIEGSAAARGMLNSGRTMKELTRFGQDYAANEYQNAYNREYNRLSALAGFGNQATGATANAAGQYGQAVGSNMIGLGNSIASANIAQANRMSNLLGQGAMAYAISDARVKTNIAPVDLADLEEMKKFLKAYAFNYVSNNYGEGEWVGVMAQDLEKSKLGRTLVVDGEDGLKRIDLRKVLSMFLATMAEEAA